MTRRTTHFAPLLVSAVATVLFIARFSSFLVQIIKNCDFEQWPGDGIESDGANVAALSMVSKSNGFGLNIRSGDAKVVGSTFDENKVDGIFVRAATEISLLRAHWLATMPQMAC